MSEFIKLYHKLPYPLRLLAINIKGYSLRRWRYGPQTEQLINEVLSREKWSVKEWELWQKERLSFILERAATKVPFYRDYWLKRKKSGDKADWRELANWPILKKEEVRENPLLFVAEDCNIKKMFCNLTSGTTGAPLSIYTKRKNLRRWYAFLEARLRKWQGVSIKERWAILGGQLIVPISQSNPPFWVHNIMLNQLYLSAQHVSAKNAKDYAKIIREYNPTHMIVYPSIAYNLATEIIKQRLELPDSVKVVFSNAEVLLEKQREAIGKAFKCKVVDTYGMGEMVFGASECEHGSMHIWPDVGKIEICKDNEDAISEEGCAGRIIITGLLNGDMPLIRYEVGDRGKLSVFSQCLCGRTLPCLKAIEGRINDHIVTYDGRKIFWINPIFYGLAIKEAQVVQETLKDIRVMFVSADNYTSEDGKKVIERLRQRVGNVDIKLEEVESIPRGVNGKLQLVISKVKVD